MAFEIYIVDHAPMTDVDDPELVALQFMEDIGYIMKHYDPKTPADSVKPSGLSRKLPPWTRRQRPTQRSAASSLKVPLPLFRQSRFRP